MKKRFISVSVVAVVVCLVMTICGISLAHASSLDNTFYYQLGELERSFLDDSVNIANSEAVIEGDNFVITELELDYYNDRRELIESYDESAIDESVSAADYLVERESLFVEAIESGIYVTDAELDEYIQEQVDAFNSLELDTDMELYLEALGMTWSEYWNHPAQVEVLTRDLYISKYKDSLRENIAEENGIDIDLDDSYYVTAEGLSGNGLNAENYQMVETELDLMVKDIVEKQTLKYNVAADELN